MSTPISSQIQSRWSTLAADNKMTRRELDTLTQELVAANPDVDQNTIQESVSAFIKQAKQGEASETLEFVEDGIEFAIKDTSITDINGVQTAGKGDLRGHIGEIRARIPFQEKELNQLLDSIKPALVQATRDAVREEVNEWTTPAPPEATDGMLDKLGDAFARGAKSFYGDYGDQWVERLARFTAEQSEIRLTKKGDQGVIEIGLKAGTVEKLPKPLRMFLGSETRKAMVTEPLLQFKSNAEGHIEIIQAESLKGLLPGADTVQDYLKDMGITSEVREEKGTYTLVPTALHLTSEHIQNIPGLSEIATEHIKQGELHLSAHQFKIHIGPSGIEIALTDATLKGSSDAGAAAAVENDRAATATIEQASGSISEDLSSLSLHELTGKLTGRVKLDQEVVQAIQTRVNEALETLNSTLKQYGLSREQLSEIVEKVPTESLENLLSSTHTGDIATLADRFGVSGKSLSSALNFLREQPLQQMIGDLQKMSERLAMDTEIQGEVHLGLKHLSLQLKDANLSTLARVQLKAQGRAVSPAGHATQLQADVQSHDVKSDGERLETGETTARLRAEAEPDMATPDRQIAKFMLDLKLKGDTFRQSRDGDVYLKDEGPQRLRKQKGLRAESALKELEKATGQEWAQLTQKSLEARQDFFAEKGIQYGDYLHRYIQHRVLTAAPTEKIEAEASLHSARLERGNSELQQVQASATLHRQEGQSQTQARVEASVQRVAAQDGQGIAEQPQIQADVDIKETSGERTRAHAKAKAQDVQTHADSGQAALQARQTEVEGHIQTEGSGNKVDTRLKGGFDQISANPEEIRGRAGRLDHARFDHGGSRINVSSSHIEVRAQEAGLDVDTRFRWNSKVKGQNSTTRLEGETSAAVRSGRLKKTTTTELTGDIKTRTSVLLDLLKSSPSLASMGKYLSEKGILGNDAIQVKIENKGPIVTDRQGEMKDYHLQVRARKIPTRFGTAHLNFDVKKEHHIQGTLQLNPNRFLEKTLEDSIRQMLPQNIGVVNVKITGNQLKLSLDEEQLETLEISLRPDGNNIQIQVDQAQLENGLKKFFAKIAGIDPRKEATEIIRQNLHQKGLGAERVSGNQYAIRIPTQRMLQEVLGPDVARRARISPEIRQGNIHLSFQH